MKITIPNDIFRAAMLFMAKKEIRYYLNGIHFKHVDGKTVMTASDGRTMFRYSFESDEPFEEFVLCRSIFDGFKFPKSSSAILTDVSLDLDRGFVSVNSESLTTKLTKIDGHYPHIPTEKLKEPCEQKETLAFNTEYIDRVGKARKLMGYRTETRFYNYESCLFWEATRSDGEIIIIVMKVCENAKLD